MKIRCTGGMSEGGGNEVLSSRDGQGAWVKEVLGYGCVMILTVAL